MKIKAVDSICIWSENPEALANWYQEMFDLEVDEKLDLPDDTGTSFMIDGVILWIGLHDGVHGKASDKYRIMPGFAVDSVKKIYDDLSSKGVEFLRKPSISPTEDYYAATAVDLDGNIIQFFSDNL